MTAAEKILQKALVESKAGIDTRAWGRVQAGLRDRAFWSSEVGKAKILYVMRANAAEVLRGRSESEARREIRAYLARIRYDAGENRGTIKDLTTKARLDVMLRTNADQARGYVSHLRATSAGALLAFPAYELVRVEGRRQPRDWSARWAEAARKTGYEGVAKKGGMIALKTSPVWAAISRFGNPFPPFDFNSGMGVRDVAKSRCREIGLLGKDEQPKIPDPPDFNGNLQSEVPFGKDSREYTNLRRAFGDQIQFDERTHTVKWRSDLFADAFEPGGKFTFRLGEPTASLLARLPDGIPADAIKGKGLTVNENWLDRRRRDGVTDHRVHFGEMPDEPEDIPLKKGDVDMLPSLWRCPDRTFADRGSLVLEVDAIDGGMFRAVVRPGNPPFLQTFYRTKESWADYLKRKAARVG